MLRASPVSERRVLGVDEAGVDEVGRMDPCVGDRNAARGAYCVARANCPAVLNERDRGGGVARDGLINEPILILGREVAALGFDPRLHEADQRAQNGPGVLGVAGREAGVVQAPDDAVGVL